MLKQKVGKDILLKSKHSSLDLPVVETTAQDTSQQSSKTPETTKSKMPSDVWWNKFSNLSEVLKPKCSSSSTETQPNNNNSNNKKSKTQTTLDYFLKSKPKSESVKESTKDKRKIRENGRPSLLQKQMSVGSYPILLNIPEESVISRDRPATVCGAEKTPPSNLERPRKKLSFREPEISGYSRLVLGSETLPRKNNIKPFNTPQMQRSVSVHNGIMQKWASYEDLDLDLETQAMRVVRTVGQAFEVCHKLDITGPNPDRDEDEETQLSQDLHSDILSSDKPSTLKRDGDGNGSDRGSLLAADETSDRGGAGSITDIRPPDRPLKSQPLTLDILPPPPTSNSTSRRSDMNTSETYVSPLTEPLRNASGNLPAAGSALSAHHELQLLREQLEQQTQQTQAALGQIQLLRDQLAAEQSARLEAQARTHQLLVHNKELLDHITALVSHLQDNERSGAHGQQQPHVTMVPQQHQGLCGADPYQSQESTNQLDQSMYHHSLGLIENRTLPSSPLRNSYNPAFTFNYPPPSGVEPTHQLLQRLQTLSGYTPPIYPVNLIQNPYQFPQIYNTPANTYNLQPPPQQKLPPSPLAVRHSQFNPGNSPVPEPGQSPKDEPREEVKEAQFIRPLSQVGTLTTTDYDGRVRVIVPVPSGAEDAGDLLRSLRIDEYGRSSSMNMPTITRSTSEKVPNRSELMSQVQRTAWARHTTK